MSAKKWLISLSTLGVVGASAGIIYGNVWTSGDRSDLQDAVPNSSVGTHMPVPEYFSGDVDEMIATVDSGMPVPGFGDDTNPVPEMIVLE